MKRFNHFFAVVLFLFLLSCKKEPKSLVMPDLTSVNGGDRLQKFEPAKGKVLLFAGQELESVGGLDNYADGYFNYFPAPGGFTAYTGFGNNLSGLTTTDNWGDGPENMSLQVTDPDFKNTCLAIGLDISNGGDEKTANGQYDALIQTLGNWIKALGERPVFLRIGYEFDGFDWNHYKKEFYVPAFKRIRDKFTNMSITNVAYVWQSRGTGSVRATMDEFYPGDDYVDWVGYSFFIPQDANHPMIQFARDHKKPLFIAEASPVLLDAGGVSKPLDLTIQSDAEWAWVDWFTPFFNTVTLNSDVVKAISYINAPWKTRLLWQNNPFFKNIDARITKNDFMKTKWLSETGTSRYMNASDTLFRYLYKK